MSSPTVRGFVAALIFCLVSVQAVTPARCSDPALGARNVRLPADWRIYEYAWGGNDSLIVGYTGRSSEYRLSRLELPQGSSDRVIRDKYNDVSLPFAPNIKIDMSPDGRFLLGNDGLSRYAVADIASGRTETWERSGTFSAWTSDSAFWLEARSDTVSATVTAHRNRLVGGSPVVGALHDGSSFTVDGVVEFIGFVNPDRLLVMDGTFYNKVGSKSISSYRLDENASLVYTHHLALPNECAIADASISPDHRRICWLVLEPQADRVTARGAEGEDRNRPMRATVWISDGTGASIKKISDDSCRVTPASLSMGGGGGLNAWPRHLSWSPDGRFVAYMVFNDENQIYIVDVPKS